MNNANVFARASLAAFTLILPCLAAGTDTTQPATGAGGQRQPGSGIEEILVQGTNSDIATERAIAARIAGNVTVVDIDDMRQQSLQNLADVLRFSPGIWADSPTGGESVFFSSRGSNLDATDYDDNGIKLLQDGLPVSTADGNNHNRAIDPLSARSATIARGANGMSFGASTLGGAINFNTPTARDYKGVNTLLNGGSNGLLAPRVTAAGENGALDGLITAEARSWDGYRDHNQEERKGVYGNSGWQVNEQVATRFYGTWLDNDQDLPGALTREQYDQNPDQANPAAVNGDYQLDVDTWRVANRTSWQTGRNSRWEFGVSYEEQSLRHPIVDKILVDFDGPGPLPPTEVFSLLIDTDHRDVGAMVRYQYTVGAHELLAGVNFGDGSVDGGHYRNDGGRANGLSANIDNNATTWTWFAQDSWNLTSKFALISTLQVVDADRETRSEDVNSGDVTAPSGNYDSINPRVGFVWNAMDDAAVYGNVSRLYEPPTNFELQDDVRASNEALDAMYGTVAEVGVRGSRPISDDSIWRWDLAVYYAGIRDEILSVDDPDAPGTSLSTNIDKTIHAGVEALLGGSVPAGSSIRLEPTVSLTLNRFKFDDDPLYGNNDLPQAPDYAVRGELIARHVSGFFAGPTFDLIGERYADFVNSYEVDSYQLLGLRGGYDANRWRAFVDIRNLLDEDYVSTLSVRDQAAADAAVLYPGAPLSVYAGLEMTL